MIENKQSLRKLVDQAVFAPKYTNKVYVNDYLKFHVGRFIETANLLTKVIQPDSKVVDLGTYGCLVPVLKDVFYVKDITCTAPSSNDGLKHESTTLTEAENGDQYPFSRDYFDLESDFPYQDESFDVVIFTEVLEHLTVDPMATMAEINRITKKNGYLILSTPNCASSLSIYKILRGQNPFTFPVYIKTRSTDRHNREYTLKEIQILAEASGYKVLHLSSKNVYPSTWKKKIATGTLELMLMIIGTLTIGLIQPKNRGESIFLLAQKNSEVESRYPNFLYYP